MILKKEAKKKNQQKKKEKKQKFSLKNIKKENFLSKFIQISSLFCRFH